MNKAERGVMVGVATFLRRGCGFESQCVQHSAGSPVQRGEVVEGGVWSNFGAFSGKRRGSNYLV